MQIKETMAREKQISEAVRRLRMEHSQEALQHETDVRSSWFREMHFLEYRSNDKTAK